jgi:hypothetical protein
MLLYNQCLAFATSPNGMWGAYNNVNRKSPRATRSAGDSVGRAAFCEPRVTVR